MCFTAHFTAHLLYFSYVLKGVGGQDHRRYYVGAPLLACMEVCFTAALLLYYLCCFTALLHLLLYYVGAPLLACIEVCFTAALLPALLPAVLLHFTALRRRFAFCLH
jgi:hypothetical protein